MKQAARAYETSCTGARNEQFERTKLPTRAYELRLALDDSPEDEPGVRGEGAEPAIVVSHDAQAFLQRTAMVASGHTLCEVVGEDELGVVEHKGTTLGTTHETDAPVVVTREAVAKVVGNGAGEVRAGVETLARRQRGLSRHRARQAGARGCSVRAAQQHLPAWFLSGTYRLH